MRRFILGTAGHIDHGKTALVRALTGVDTDRLPEEKRRGITIDLGFARLPLGECELGIVDVPGHEAFVRNMLAGATGIDLALLVVAADEGVMPQTREHLAIIELLGVQRGVIAITKADLVDDDWLELVVDDVAQLLAPTPLAHAPIVRVSARTGQGLDTLVQTLAAVAAGAPSRLSDDLFRMPIDRVFTVRGTGTVVTGTVWSGRLRADEHVRIEPAGLSARVRALQHHGAPADMVESGARAAIALASLDRQLLRRGDTVVTGAGWAASSILTARIAMVRDAAAPLRPRQRVRVHVGTSEVLGRVALLERELPAGELAIVQLRLEAPLLARTRDHVILRSYSPVFTIAGGIVLEPNPPKRKRLTAETRRHLQGVLLDSEAPAAVVALAAGDVITSQLPIRTGLTPAEAVDAVARDHRLTVVGDRLFDARRLDRCRDEILRQVTAHHATYPLDDGVDRELLRRSVDETSAVFDVALQRAFDAGTLLARGSAIAESQYRPHPTAADQQSVAGLAAAFETAALQAPSLDELPSELTGSPHLLSLLRYLEREGVVVRIATDRWMSAAALLRAATALRAQLPAAQPLDIAEFRNVLGLSRKHLIPLLEYFDRTGVTVRRGDARLLSSASKLVPFSS